MRPIGRSPASDLNAHWKLVLKYGVKTTLLTLESLPLKEAKISESELCTIYIYSALLIGVVTLDSHITPGETIMS